LEEIFINCQQLERIKFWLYNTNAFKEKKLLEVIAKHSPKKFYELEIDYSRAYGKLSELLPEELESFFYELDK